MNGVDFQSRKKRRRPKSLSEHPGVFLLETVICLLILGGAAYGVHRHLYRSSDFLVKKIQVDGIRVLRAEDLVQVAGITKNDTVMGVDVRAIEARLRNIAYVKTCRVTRSFPDKVVIQIEERVPVATLLADNHSFAIDEEGVVLRELPFNGDHEGPYISEVPDLGVVEVGLRLSQPALLAALQVWQAFSKTSMAKDVTVSEFSSPSTNNVRMYCNELAYEIRWGRGAFTQEARRLDRLWTSKNKQIGCTEYLDLRFGDDLACK